MKFHYTDLETCHEAKGVVIVIDVLRAFSTAAYAFSRGAKEILLVSTVDEALALKSQIQNSLAMGEVGGLRPEGFDFGNSPTYINQADLAGITMIHRTSAGTQGVVLSQNAEVMLVASFVVATATARYVERLDAPEVTFVITGRSYNGGDEDLACAEYLESLLRGDQPEEKSFIRRVLESKDAFPHLDPAQRDYPLSDLDFCAQVDRFDFAMPVIKENGHYLMRTDKPT
ncbi:MAG TPA: 2-phosphosulfolactate phosphatase [Anaerolineales bacterium]|nr:2-phosphosulfolactate phosphatase [Anaerolineales bacterium]